MIIEVNCVIDDRSFTYNCLEPHTLDLEMFTLAKNQYMEGVHVIKYKRMPTFSGESLWLHVVSSSSEEYVLELSLGVHKLPLW